MEILNNEILAFMNGFVLGAAVMGMILTYIFSDDKQ